MKRDRKSSENIAERIECSNERQEKKSSVGSRRKERGNESILSIAIEHQSPDDN